MSEVWTNDAGDVLYLYVATLSATLGTGSASTLNKLVTSE